MPESRLARRPVASPDTPDRLATSRQCYGALSVAVLLVCAATLTALFGRAAGPEIKPFVPITATIWSLADLLTGFLLLAQFYINRRLLFGILSFAYAFSGLMTWTFIGTFPHLFSNQVVTLASEQIPSFAWYLWHATFPILLLGAVALDARLEAFVSRGRAAALTGLLAILPALAAGTTTFLAIVFRGALPHFIVHGDFQPIYRLVLLPFLAALNAGASFNLLWRRNLTPLKLWLGLATFAGCIDVLLVELSSARYSYAWDIGKLLTVVTGSIVLIMMLWDVIGMYARLARIERIDPLTSLRTRHAFEEHLRSLFQKARRRAASLGLVVIAVDSFERYSDSHGAVASEEASRRIARELLVCAPRPVDFIARYGAGEFVMLLPDVSLVNVRATAERVRSIVQGLQIVRGRTAFGAVTVSIGIGYTNDALSTDEEELFDMADRALEDAIARGCNRVVLRSIDPRPVQDEQIARVTVGSGSVAR